MIKAESVSPEEGGAAQLLEQVCPGRVVTGKEITCRGGCAKFPYLPQPGLPGGWRITGVIRGRFLQPDREDAVLSTDGCEPHVTQWGGSILIPGENPHRLKPRYYSGLISRACHKIQASDGRDLLVCETTDAHQGYLTREISLNDFRIGQPSSRNTILVVEDSMNACGGQIGGQSPPAPVGIRAYLERLEFSDNKMIVYARRGEWRFTEEQLNHCKPELIPHVPTKSYRIEFLFDGRRFQVAPADRKTSALFKLALSK